MSAGRGGGRAGSLLLGAALLLLAFGFQGSRPLADPDEGRYVEAARGMIVAHDPLVPRIDGRPHLTKPPGTYLAVVAGLTVGGMNEWGARAATGVAFLAWMLAARSLGRLLGGSREAGAWGAIALGTSLLPFVGGSLVTADPFIAALDGVAVAAFARALVDPARRRAAARAGWAVLGAAFFFKGPPSLLPLAGFALAWPRRAAPRRGERPADAAGLALFAALAAWWYLWLLAARRADFLRLVRTELYQRLFTAELNRSGPVWLPLAMFVAGVLPWGLVLLPSARSRLRAAWATPVGRLLIGWTGAGLLAFTLSKGRMPLYVLPLTFAVAVPAGVRVARLAAGSRAWAAAAVAVALITGGGLVAGRALIADSGKYRHSRDLAAAVLARQRAPAEPVVVLDTKPRPGLAFALQRDLETIVPGSPEMRRLQDLAAAPDGVLTVAPRGRFAKLPPALEATGVTPDGPSRFDLARVRLRRGTGTYIPPQTEVRPEDGVWVPQSGRLLPRGT